MVTTRQNSKHSNDNIWLFEPSHDKHTRRKQLINAIRKLVGEMKYCQAVAQVRNSMAIGTNSRILMSILKVLRRIVSRTVWDDIMKRCSMHSNPIHYICRYCDSVKFVNEIIIKTGSSYIEVGNTYHTTLLHAACRNHNPIASIDIITMLIKQAPISLKMYDIKGCLPLHHACEFSNSEQVIIEVIRGNREALIIKNANGRIPLQMATSYNTTHASRAISRVVLLEQPILEQSSDNVMHLYYSSMPAQEQVIIRVILIVQRRFGKLDEFCWLTWLPKDTVLRIIKWLAMKVLARIGLKPKAEFAIKLSKLI